KAFELFLKAKKDKPNDITGYRKFFELADRLSDSIKKDNKYYMYDVEIENYLLYADSLSVYSPNGAENQLDYLRELKKQGLINNRISYEK
ncbi:MAG: hypothetical protein LBT43_16285, partial [Prevotella sp.]|nr:hypothetical protein [Prevotella sp.]